MRFWFGVCLLALGLRTATAFSPYYATVGGQPLRWDFNSTTLDPHAFNTATKAIRFYIATNTYSVGNRTAEMNAIRAAIGQWQAIPGTILKIEDAGLASGNVQDVKIDGTNTIFWTTNTFIGGVSMSGRAAYTQVIIDSQNHIVEADTALNAWLYSWFTDVSNTNTGAQLVEAVVAHEMGHFLGLDHTPLGGGTVFDGGSGICPEFGLSSDEMAAARFLYPTAATSSQFGTISGFVHMNGAGIHGAIVTAETAQGIVISGTASDTAGNYKLPGLPPGSYNVHVSPMDPDTASVYGSLFRPSDIAGDFGAATTAFKATENSAATVTGGATTTLNFNVTSGEPAFRIQQITKPTALANAPSPVRFGVGVNQGLTVYVGAAGQTIPSAATLSITGDGITVESTTFQANRFSNPSLNLLWSQITIASNATPGLRTIVVRNGTDVAYANGYLEIYPPFQDYNFDGLDDHFQRQYFSLFTAPQAAPGADPDGDRFSNAFEALTGSNPTNALSYNFLIQQLDLVRGAPRVTWKSDIGKQYQLYGKADVAGTTWQTIGSPVTATTNVTSQSDGSAPGVVMFYKLKLLP
jgi:hypothetical protein